MGIRASVSNGQCRAVVICDSVHKGAQCRESVSVQGDERAIQESLYTGNLKGWNFQQKRVRARNRRDTGTFVFTCPGCWERERRARDCRC